jgi:hypothetical protein
LQDAGTINFHGLVRDDIDSAACVSCIFYVFCTGNKLVWLQQNKFTMYLAGSYVKDAL